MAKNRVQDGHRRANKGAAPKLCIVEGCDRAGRITRGMCDLHYQRWQTHGNPLISKIDRQSRHITCTVDGCSTKHSTKGLCLKHARRLEKYGSLNGFHEGYLRTRRWMQENVAYEGDDCLAWPFTRSPDTGRGNATWNGKETSAPRVMCIMAYGEPPTEAHEAAHSCGNGHLGCINPRHLRWTTRSGNIADMAEHGTLRRGSAVNTSKLSADQVREIRQRAASERQNKLAREYGVTVSAVCSIVNRKSWAWLE